MDEEKKDEEIEKEKVELSEQVVELSSQPSAEPIKHSPEMSSESAEGFTYAKNKQKGMLDNVLDKLSKYMCDPLVLIYQVPDSH